MQEALGRSGARVGAAQGRANSRCVDCGQQGTKGPRQSAVHDRNKGQPQHEGRSQSEEGTSDTKEL